MNWTGGRLQRHSKNSGSTVLKRQKQHFARMRTQLRSNNHVPTAIPFEPSFIRAEGTTSCGDLPLVEHHDTRHLGRQRAQRRSAGKSFADNAARHDSSPATPLPPNIVDSHGDSRRATIAHAAGETYVPAVIEMQSPSAHRSAPSTIKKRQPRDAHVRLTGSQPLDRATKRRQGSVPSISDGEFKGERRRLLQRTDWAGLAPSRPLQMHFPSTHEKDKVGKRRRVATNLAARHDREERARPIRTPPLRHRTRIHDHVTNHYQREGITVRVGVEALAGPSSEDEGKLEVPRHAQSSDSMLLDAEHGRNTEAQQSVFISSPCAAEPACNCYTKSDRSQKLRSTRSPDAGHVEYQRDYPIRSSSHAPGYGGERRGGPCLRTDLHDQDVGTSRKSRRPGCLVFDTSPERMAENPMEDGGNPCHAQPATDGFLHAAAYTQKENPVSISSPREADASWGVVRLSDSITNKPLYALPSKESNPPETGEDVGNGSMHYHAPGNIRPRGNASSRLAETDPSAKARMVNAMANRATADTKELDGTSKATVAAVTENCPQSSLWQIVDPCVQPTALSGGGADNSDGLWRRFVFSDGSSALSDAGREDEDGIIPLTEPIVATDARNNRLLCTNPLASAYSTNTNNWSVVHPSSLGSRYKDRAMLAREHVVFATEEEDVAAAEAADVTGPVSMYNNASLVSAYFTHGNENAPASAAQSRATDIAPVRPLLNYENVTQLDVPGASAGDSRDGMVSLERPHRLTFSKPRVLMGTRSGTGNLRDGPGATSAMSLKRKGKIRTRREAGAVECDMAVSGDDEFDSIED